MRWASHLDAFSGYPLHTWLPSVSHWRENWYTRGVFFQVLSYYGRLLSMLQRLHRIWTELSHDVLNPAHVPLPWANSPTLGTYYRPRLRRADIEVPNLPVDVNSWGRSACYPRVTFIRLATALPHGTVGSLRPAFAPARLVGLAVKLPSAFTLYG